MQILYQLLQINSNNIIVISSVVDPGPNWIRIQVKIGKI